MRGLILTLLTFSGLFSQTVNISGTYQDLLNNPIDSTHVYYYQDEVIVDSTMTSSSGSFALTVDVVGVDPSVPSTFHLAQNYPNPFNPSTRIDLNIQAPGILTIYDIRGARVESLELPSAGRYELTWGGRNLSAGLYIYVLRSGSQSSSRKMILLDGGDESGLTANQLSFGSSKSLSKPASNDALRFEKFNTTPLEIDFFTPQADTSLDGINGNVGPRQIQTIRDTTMNEGDTLSVDWDEYFYNDSETFYPPQFVEFMYLTDTTFYDAEVVAIDILDTSLIAVSNTFRVSWINVNESPVELDSIPDYEIDEDELVELVPGEYYMDPDGDTLTYIFYTPEDLSSWTISGDTVRIIPHPDVNESMEIWYSVTDGEFYLAGNLYITINPVDDIPRQITDLPNLETTSGTSVGINLIPYVFEVDGETLTYTVNLSTDLWNVVGDSLTFVHPEGFVGSYDDVIITAHDGANSLALNSIAVVVEETPSVHFALKDFQTDSTLAGESTTFTINGVDYFTTTGELDLSLIEGTYDIVVWNPDTWMMQGLRRPNDIDNFDQYVANSDEECQFSIIGNDTINVYQLLLTFPLNSVAPYIDHLWNGTVRFRTEDLEGPARYDLNYDPPYAHITEWMHDFLENRLPPATLGKLNLQYEEDFGQPEVNHLWMSIDPGHPTPGVNGTQYNEFNEITSAMALWSSDSGLPSVYVVWVEIMQAIGDLPDLDGTDPPFISYNPDGPGLIINQLGYNTLSLLYFLQPGTHIYVPGAAPSSTEIVRDHVIPYVISHKSEMGAYLEHNGARLIELGYGLELGLSD
jgi:hypothetical protein